MLTNANKKVLEVVMDNGLLPSYAWPGGYPMYYLDNENNVLCPDCANKNDEFTEPLVDYDVNWENDQWTCNHCHKRIESAYGEEESE